MVRTEDYDDPAPKPNSLVVAASAVVTDDRGRILLQRRRDDDLWALPGGGMDMDDSLPGCALREVREETGYDVEITGGVCFRARIVGGELTVSDESTEVRFVAPTDLDALPMHHTQRLRIGHYLENRPTPYLG